MDITHRDGVPQEIKLFLINNGNVSQDQVEDNDQEIRRCHGSQGARVYLRRKLLRYLAGTTSLFSTSQELKNDAMFFVTCNTLSTEMSTSPRPSPHLHCLPLNNHQTSNRLYVYSKLPSFQDSAIQPCHGRRCKTCQNVDMGITITCEDTSHHVRGRYSCDSANIVYLIRCRQGRLEAWYTGETEQRLQQQMNGHHTTINRQKCCLPVRDTSAVQDIRPRTFG
ncbi:uncharacterized protein LOC132814206 isoform X1 [Hemiscyllium ocellatum]|uniref:uncharacterized protein LOC132809340 isoform X1 n=1 Tax=Hemiscyllium ocellatum TaxID=170820 RepID=UPI0029662119|nr:uncharacterized protein LOC132809340 isoform X1 [Hemiscyllium ocellatum]XP_060679135.1 uncharacterized protein LOC132813429 isoform X2 [Hemiscyllium ocellatum]XP_060679408.1 uncharacterized protein LOC132814206 isoform X1 [Hemiscyllium ocellatum]